MQLVTPLTIFSLFLYGNFLSLNTLTAGIWHVNTHVVGVMLSIYLPIVGSVHSILYSMTAIPEGIKSDTLSGPGLYAKLQCFIWVHYIIPSKLIFS